MSLLYVRTVRAKVGLPGGTTKEQDATMLTTTSLSTNIGTTLERIIEATTGNYSHLYDIELAADLLRDELNRKIERDGLWINGDLITIDHQIADEVDVEEVINNALADTDIEEILQQAEL